MENNLRQLCKNKGITPYRMGKDLNIPFPAVYNYINSKRVPSTERAIVIAKYFNKEVREIWT